MEEKYCSKCGNAYPENSKYFHRDSRTKSGFRSICKECVKEYTKTLEYKYRPPTDESRKKRKERIDRNRETYSKKWKEYKEYNKEKITAQKQEYYKANREILLESARKYYRKNKDNVMLKKNIYTREKYGKYKSDKYGVADWVDCKNAFEHKCAYCGESPSVLVKDHFIPYKKGGEFSKSNIIPSCGRCNSSKKDRSFFEWYPKQTYYSKEREQTIIKYINHHTCSCTLETTTI